MEVHLGKVQSQQDVWLDEIHAPVFLNFINLKLPPRLQPLLHTLSGVCCKFQKLYYYYYYYYYFEVSLKRLRSGRDLGRRSGIPGVLISNLRDL